MDGTVISGSWDKYFPDNICRIGLIVVPHEYGRTGNVCILSKAMNELSGLSYL